MVRGWMPSAWPARTWLALWSPLMSTVPRLSHAWVSAPLVDDLDGDARPRERVRAHHARGPGAHDEHVDARLFRSRDGHWYEQGGKRDLGCDPPYEAVSSYVVGRTVLAVRAPLVSPGGLPA